MIDDPAWYRFTGLLIPQLVILYGLWVNRRSDRATVSEPVERIETKVDKVQDTMTAHLLDHSSKRR